MDEWRESGRRCDEASAGWMPTSKKIMSQRNMTWSEGAVPPRFGYFVEGQSNAVGRPVGDKIYSTQSRYGHQTSEIDIFRVDFIL